MKFFVISLLSILNSGALGSRFAVDTVFNGMVSLGSQGTLSVAYSSPSGTTKKCSWTDGTIEVSESDNRSDLRVLHNSNSEECALYFQKPLTYPGEWVWKAKITSCSGDCECITVESKDITMTVADNDSSMVAKVNEMYVASTLHRISKYDIVLLTTKEPVCCIVDTLDNAIVLDTRVSDDTRACDYPDREDKICIERFMVNPGQWSCHVIDFKAGGGHFNITAIGAASLDPSEAHGFVKHVPYVVA